MTPQDDRTAEVLSNALGRSTITAVTESQSRVRALEDSANVSRRSEERPLISANEVLRFPLDEVLVLPEGQYPIRARHIRYFEDRHFGPIDRVRSLHDLKTVLARGPKASVDKAALLSGLAKAGATVAATAEQLPQATAAFRQLTEAATGRRRVAQRKGLVMPSG